MNKPADWYLMDTREREDFRRDEQEREALRYERDRAERDAETAEREAQQARQMIMAERRELAQEFIDTEDRCRRLFTALAEIIGYDKAVEIADGL